MDRKMLIDLFKEGMIYPTGKHRFWISRCFEITVRPDKVVELDEYEGFSAEKNSEGPLKEKAPKGGKKDQMFHVGRSILHLEKGKVVEESGTGWPKDNS